MHTHTSRTALHLGGPAAPKRPWQDTAKARRILDALTAADLTIVAETPIMGDRYYRWSAGEQHDDLTFIRAAEIEAQFGCTFLEASEQGRTAAFLELYGATPSVADVLAERFGSPSRFGRPTNRLIDCDRGTYANARWALEQVAA